MDNKLSGFFLLLLMNSTLFAQCIPSFLNLNYKLAVVETGGKVEVTWESDCNTAIMNVALVSLPPLPYQVQQIDYAVPNSGAHVFTIQGELPQGEYQFYVEDEDQNIWDYGDTFSIQGCSSPSMLDLTYNFDHFEIGDTAVVTWDSDCDQATMNISLVSLPPLPYQVQQVDNGISNSGTRSFVFGPDLQPGEYQFYIEDENQIIWDYGDSFLIQGPQETCEYPTVLNLTYDFNRFETGDTAMVQWDADCGSSFMNISLVSLPPLPFQVQQVDNRVSNTGSRPFVLSADLEAGEYQFYIEDENQTIWDYGDEFFIASGTTAVSEKPNAQYFYYDPSQKWVRWNHMRFNSQYQVFDSLGRFVGSASTNDGHIDVSAMPNGLYFLKSSENSLFKFAKY